MQFLLSKYLRILILVAFTGSTSIATMAQGQLKGKILDSLNNKPVEYALISLYKSAEQKPLLGKLTDTSGIFIFNEVAEGNYDVKIDLIGYKPKWIRNLKQSGSGTTDIGQILFTSTQVGLAEVTVNGQQDPNQNKIDRQTYKADQFLAAKGGTALDVLKNTPSVTVTAEGDIRLRGSNGFLILINGKPVISDANTVLAQIPANAIENIEILTAPSAKYDADGKSGIINITTKKGTDDGLSFIVNTQYGLPTLDNYNNKEKPNRYGADFTLNYKKDKWDWSVGASYLQNDIQGQRDGEVNTTLGNTFTTFPSLGERSFDRRNYSGRASVTYTANKFNALNIGVYLGQRQQFRLADIDYNTTRTNANTGAFLSNVQYFNSNLVKKQGDFSLINFDYTHTFKNKSSLTFSALYEYAYLDGFTKNIDFKDQNATNQNGSIPSTSNSNDSNQNPSNALTNTYNSGLSPIQGFRGKIDYSINIGKGKLESGYQLRRQHQTGEYLYQTAIVGTNNFITVPQFSANIDIYNLIHGLYSQYNGKAGKLEYIAGLRYEYAERRFSADKLNTPYQLSLNNLFPSANALYTIKPLLKAKAGFSRRVQRSTNNELNPYPEREHAETLEQGDPNIKPEFVNVSELGITKEFSKGSVFLTAYNQYTENVVNRVNSVYTDTIINRIYTNAGNATQWGAETGINLKPVKWWTAFIGANVYDYSIKGNLFNNAVTVNNSAVAYSINTNHNFQVEKTLSLQFNLNYLSQRPTAIGEDSRFFSPNLSVKKTFLAGKIAAVFQWQNIGFGSIQSNQQRITARGNDFYTTTNYIQERDVLWVNLSYNFKQSNKKLKLPTSEFGEKEF